MTVAITPRELFLSDVDDDRAMQEIVTVTARAARFAPCLLGPLTPAVEAAMKGILIDVIKRRYKFSGAKTVTAGGRSEQFEIPSGGLFWPSEIAELQALCAGSAASSVTLPVYSFPDPQPWPDGLGC